MADTDVYHPSQGPLNQGDILAAPVVRVVAADCFVPDKWDRIDQNERILVPPNNDTDAIYVTSGWTLVMVTSHDCHHDKEWNAKRGRLIREGHSVAEAEGIAESDLTLDRTFRASPLIPLDDIAPNRRQSFKSGHAIGYFPLPEPPDGSFPTCVVDLAYRCTIDRLAYAGRRWCLSKPARDRLRHAIARFDSFWSVQVASTIEEAIGRTITNVSVDSTQPLAVDLSLDDGSVLQLVQAPVEPEPSGRSGL